MVDPKKFDFILASMVQARGLGKKMDFPDAEKLLSKSRVFLPDREESFQEAMDVYRHLNRDGIDPKRLFHGAVCLYVSYEMPPDWVRMAIINLLRAGGDYKNACQYALESFTLEYVQNLLCGNLPFRIKNHELNIHHLVLPYWTPEMILAVIVRELRGCEQLERESILRAIIYKISKPEYLPEPLLEAVCTFLYQNLLQLRPADGEKLNQIILENTYPKIAEEFLRQYSQSSVMIDFTVRECDNNTEWMNRQAEFKRLYADREKKGYFIYNPSKGAVLLHKGLLMVYKLNPNHTAAQADILNADITRDISLSCKYKLHSGSFQIYESSPLKYEEMELLENRIQILKNLYHNDADLINAYELLKENLQIAFLFREVNNFEDGSCNIKSRFKLFFCYVNCKWHDRELAKKMVSFLLKNYSDKLSDKNYMSLFNYYLQIGDSISARSFVHKYKIELGKQYYLANKQLLALEKQKGNTNTLHVDAEWNPIPLKKGYGKFAEYFLKYGWDMLQQECADLSIGDSMELYDEAERLRQKALNNANQKNIAAEYYLKAGAVLNRRREWFGDSDTNEAMTDYMIHSFYNRSYQEAGNLDINEDVRRTYLEQALRLSKQLNPGYIDCQLGDMLEDMQKRYFKVREGHDNGNLKDSVKYMSQKLTVSDTEFGNSLLRLSIYYPDFLLNPQIVDLCTNDEEIKRHLSVFLQSSRSGSGTSNGILDWMQSYRNKVVREFNDINFYFDGTGDDKAELQRSAERLQQFRKEKELYCVLSETDKKYVTRLEALLLKLPDENIDFQKLCEYQRQCGILREEMKKYPCSFAIEYLFECVSVLADYAERLYGSLHDEVQPELQLQALFAENVPKEPDTVRVYLMIKNRKGKSAVSNVTATVKESEWVSETDCQHICAYVGGAREYGFVMMHLTASVSKKEKLNFDIKIGYIVEMTGDEMSENVRLEVNLSNRRLDTDYEQMYNHGTALDAGQGMAEYTFYGRDEMINRICQIFYDFPMSIVVLYGQKRVGKTSIANHIAAKIQSSDKKFLVVKCGNLNLNVFHDNKADFTEDVIQEFYTMVMQKLIFAIERTGKRTDCLDKEIKEIKVMLYGTGMSDTKTVTPMLFRKLIMEVQQAFEHEEYWNGTRILLWFDEFQQYYLKILEGKIQPETVAFIKAFTEEYGFSLLLVGCEPMLPFIQDTRFGNMFSASTQEYVEYLTEESAKRLICEPIQKKCNRQNPFIYVEDEIYHFSAGSPFFIQLICENLITELNQRKKVYADKYMIIESLHEKQKVRHAFFNCLFDSLNTSEKGASPEDNKKVLICIALRQGKKIGSKRCDIIHDLEGKTQKDVLKIIDELISRKVVEEVQDELRIVVRLYEAWIWENRFELGFDK